MDVPEQPDVEVHNLVATGDFDSRLNLSAIAVGLGLEHIEYEPEHFSGLVYRPPAQSVVVLLFGSGKVVLVGARSWLDLEKALESVYRQLDELDLLLETSA